MLILYLALVNTKFPVGAVQRRSAENCERLRRIRKQCSGSSGMKIATLRHGKGQTSGGKNRASK